ncbi:MAG TPA: endonuclease/exonuclease/phosphatase family protein [Tangfeifania sp.]|nr:endonuclease/exonuclease/phosphatase family protein [Tangfeifania sp.]
MKNRFFLSLTAFLIFSVQIYAQNHPDAFSVLFYNVENLFDTQDDSATIDEEFTPGGDRRWTNSKLNEKLLNISKVILNSSGWEPPQVIGLCEIENRFVLEKLLTDTPLKRYPYKIIHKESPDERGIDVALIYNEDVFYPLFYRYHPLLHERGAVEKTREILYVSGILNETDTLHFFVNHWPSRYGGLLETQSLRNLAAQTLRNLYDTLQVNHSNPKVILMGDFNDQPQDESIARFLKTKDVEEKFGHADIVNLSEKWTSEEIGTIKYQSQWSVFDQVMVSGSLLLDDSGFTTSSQLAQIVKLPFLLEKDERYGGIKTNRTFIGYRYNGGFSDHLPVLLRLKTTP